MTVLLTFSLVTTRSDEHNNTNPLMEEFETSFQAPPFDSIKSEHFKPALTGAIEAARIEVDKIVKNANAPNFENTIEALAMSGKKLNQISSIMFNLNYAETDSVLQSVVRDMAPIITDFQNDISLNPLLFERVKKVWDKYEKVNLSPEQKTLIEKTYKNFIRNGANLNPDKKKSFRNITRELSQLSLKFEENVLAETNSFFLHLTDDKDLEGLPQSLIDAAKIEAKQKKLKGWVITLHSPMYIPFMKYSERRELREKIYKAYSKRAFNGNKNDNTELIVRIANLRIKLANILGYSTYALYVLEERMAESPSKVNNFLEQMLEVALPFAKQELKVVNEFVRGLGVNHRIEKWDWAFYTEKLKNKLFNLKEEDLKPYFQLEKVKEGIFKLSNKLYGIAFKQIDSVPVYHPDVEVYEVNDHDGSFLALLYLDFFPREGKSGGAWMTNYREQYKENDIDVRPLISVVTNFTKPTNNSPSLLTFNELTTFLHEFGHALHGIFASSNYPSLSGTSVYRDFVELPSQIMENWAVEKEFLDIFATHYQTRKSIPPEMVQAIIESRNFLAGSFFVRQLGFGLIDMAWHTLNDQFNDKVVDFEITQLSRVDLLPKVEGTCTSTAFSHIFGGGYAAGYYGYKWAEVLDADAFSLFKEKGIFDRNTAQSFRNSILSTGGTEHPLVLYKRFRGKEPSIEPLLERSGLKN